MQSDFCSCVVYASDFSLIIPPFCHAICSYVLPSNDTCSRPKEVMPTVFVFLSTTQPQPKKNYEKKNKVE